MFRIFLFSQLLLLVSPVLAESQAKSPAQKTIEILDSVCVRNSEDFTAIDRMARALGAKELDKKISEGDPVMHKLGGKTFIFTNEGTKLVAGYAKGGGCTVVSPDIDQKRLKELLLKNYKLVHRDTETAGIQIQELFEFPKESAYAGSLMSLTYGKTETGWKEGSVSFVPANAAKKVRNSANQECIKGLTKTDMCAKARHLSDDIAKKLPMKLSQNMSWESVMAFGTTIQAHIRLSYNKKHLKEIYSKAGLPLSHAKQAIQKSAASICQENTPTRAFINLGGSFKYVYSFADGEQFTTIVVSSCN